MNPHSKGGHAAAGTHALGLPAAPPPPFPRRTIVADYCRTCGRTSGCWLGCAGTEHPDAAHAIGLHGFSYERPDVQR